MALTRLRPRPSPRSVRLVSPRNRRSQIRGNSSAGIPGPVSCTESRAAGPSRRISTSTRPPRGVYLTALSMRLAATCSSRVRSPSTTGSAASGNSPTGSDEAPDEAVVDNVIPFASATSRYKSIARSTISDSRTGSRRNCIVPLSASEMSISVVSITSTRSASSMVSASASRYRSRSGGPASAISAVPRSRVNGVRRSCDTLSSEPCIAVTSLSILSSMVLNSVVSSSRASPVPLSDTRESVRPVRMMRRTASVKRRIGDIADCVTSQPPLRAVTTIRKVTIPSAARNRASRSSLGSVLLPTCTSVPFASRTDAVSSRLGSHPFGLLSTTASTPRSTTRTNSRSGAACCSARTVAARTLMPPRAYAAA